MNLDKVCEGIHYELIPAEGTKNEQGWDVRILQGDFVETILRYGNVAFNGKLKCLNFNFKIITSPFEDLTTENEELQIYAGEILEDIMEQAVSKGSVAMKDIDDN